MIEPMAKIEIVGLFEELDATLDFLQHLATVQIEEIPTVESSGQSHLRRIHLDELKANLLARYEELLTTVHEIIDSLTETPVEKVPLEDDERERLRNMSPDEMIKHISPISREIRKLARQRRSLQQDMESTLQYEILVNTFIPLLEKTEGIGELEQVGIILKRGESSILPVLKNRIDEITGPSARFFHEKMPDGRIGVFIAVTHEDLPVVRQLLGSEGVAEYHIPREYRRKNLKESIEAIETRLGEIPGELEKIEGQLVEEKTSHVALLNFIRWHCSDRINQLRILSRLVRTHYTFMISGWTPISSLKQLEKSLNEQFGDNVYIGRVSLNDLDYLHVPTLLSNRGFFRVFEVLMKLLPPPRYENIDATPFISIFFPIFFGIILGDMGYGITLILIAGFLKLKAARGSILSDVGSIGLIAGFFTVFFGFLFGEFFGDLLGTTPVVPWLHRAAAIEVILLLSIGLGTIHIILGFLLKTYVALLMRHLKGMIEGLAKIFVIMGIIAFLAQLFLELHITVRYFAYGLLGAGFTGVVATEGIIGILEIFSMFGNILSYTRIMAIGLASVILALVANRLAQESPNIILGIFIGLSIHMINFVLGVFSPTIHSLRLHYVEFFSKFFKPSGKPFQPFKRLEES